MHKVLFFFCVALFVCSCTSNTLVSDSRAMSGYWNKNEIVSFSIPPLDSTKNYNLFLHLRNTNDYKYNNLFLITEMEFPNGKTIKDTLEYKMAYPNGEWMGEGIGNVKENKLWYKEAVSFKEQGTYILRVSHAVRNNGEVDGVFKLDGITDVGYSIEQTPNDL